MPVLTYSRKLILLPALLLVVIAGIWVWSQRASLNTDLLRLGMPTSQLRLSWKTFRYNEAGHFDTKTQFESRRPDARGATYILHCRGGKVYAVDLIYSGGAERNKALAAVSKLIGHAISDSNEHDEKELSMSGCEKPSEYFYFENGRIGVELDFAEASSTRISRVYCWTA